MNNIYMHFHVGSGRITVALASEKNDPVVHFGLALSSPKDCFKREKGRLVAAGRLRCRRDPTKGSPKLHGVFKRDVTAPLRASVISYLTDYLNEMPNMPKWAQDEVLPHQEV